MISKIKKYFLISIGILIIFVIFSISLLILKLFLGFSQEKFNEIILAGLYQSTLSGVILYIIFNELFVKRPKLRLYIEPKEVKSKEFKLDFYIKNIGNLSAKDALLIMSFPDLEIIGEIFIGGKSKRIDYLYGNTHTIQINCDKPIYQFGKGNQQIASLQFRLKELKEIKIRYVVEAERVDYFEGIYKIPVNIKI